MIAHRRSYLPAIQGLRGWSAASVLIYHIYVMGQHSGIVTDQSQVTDFLLNSLTTGVGIFFVISGYLIPGSLIKDSNLKRFFLDRFLRVFPLYIILHLLVFTLGPWVGYKWLRGVTGPQYAEYFFSNLFLVAPLLHMPVAQQNSWTLTYEWVFYLALGVAYALHKGRHRIWLGIMAAAVLLTTIKLSIVAFFLVGMALWWVGERLPKIARIPGGILALFCLICTYLTSEWNHFVGAIFVTGLFIITLDRESISAAFFSRPYMQFLGRISYSSYLLHPIVLYALERPGVRIALKFGKPVGFAFFGVAGIIGTLVISELSYRWIEVGLRKRLSSAFSRLSRQLPVETVS